MFSVHIKDEREPVKVLILISWLLIANTDHPKIVFIEHTPPHHHSFSHQIMK